MYKDLNTLLPTHPPSSLVYPSSIQPVSRNRVPSSPSFDDRESADEIDGSQRKESVREINSSDHIHADVSTLRVADLLGGAAAADPDQVNLCFALDAKVSYEGHFGPILAVQVTELRFFLELKNTISGCSNWGWLRHCQFHRRSNQLNRVISGKSSSNRAIETDESRLVVCFEEMLIDFVPTTSGLSLSEATAFKKALDSSLSHTKASHWLMGNLCLAFLFYPVTRGSSILERCRKVFSETVLAEDRLCVGLDDELREMGERMGSRRAYEIFGRAYDYVLSGLSSHSWQRANTRGGWTDGGAYYQTQSMIDMVSLSQTMVLGISPR